MITINELFSGIGAQVAAFKRLNIPYKVIGISEIDKYAIQSYEAINGSVRNYGDITQIERLDYADLWTYSFPCQDLSVAGKQRGISEETRSGLLLHVERLLTKSVLYGTQPKYLLLENVKALVSKKFMSDFQRWLDKLEQLGYNNYWQVLNAKDYGIPQNRERVFVVSIRKDIDIKGYKFPSPVPLEKRLKDMLEPWVDIKYYLSEDKVEKFLNSNFHQERDRLQTKDYCDTLLARDYKDPKLVKEVSNTIRCGGGGSLNGKHTWDIIVEPLQIKEATQKGYAEAYDGDSVSLDQPNSKTRRGRVGKQISNTLTCSYNIGVVEPKIIQVAQIYPNSGNPQAGRVYDDNGISPAMDTCSGGNRMPKILEQFRVDDYDPFLDELEDEEYDGVFDLESRIDPEEIGYRIRKLTPRECWRLMGFTDIEFDCAKLSGVSNSQLYKQAGNSIVVDVLVAIFRELFDDRF